MYIFKNALKSITRNKTRNILIGIVVVIIGISSVVALSIHSAASDICSSQIESSEVKVSFGINRESMRQNFQDRVQQEDVTNIKNTFQSLSKDEILNYANSSYVKDYYLESSIGLNSSSITAATNDNMINKINGQQGEGGSGKIQMMGKISLTKGDFTLTGYNKLNAMTDFANGTYKIIDGEMIDVDSDELTCVINKELAEENNLKVGDKITFVNPENEQETFVFTIKGIYQDTATNSDFNDMFSMSANKVITSLKGIEKVVSLSSEESKLSENMIPTILLNNMDDIQAFETEVKAKGLSDTFELTSNKEEITSSLKPIENLKQFSVIFLILVLVIGAVILLILNMIHIRERKYEIGVLRAIGMKKHLVSLQFITETFIVTMIAISIGMMIGSCISVPVANYMLENEIQTITQTNNNVNQNFGFSGSSSINVSGGRGTIGQNNNLIDLNMQDASYIDQMNATVNPIIVLEILGIAALLTMISSLISVVCIARYNPLKILSSRS